MMRNVVWMGCLSAMLLAGSAGARVEHSLGYTKQQSYNAALRFLRVDSGYKITEKDSDSGYLLFEYPTQNGDAKTHGSIEVIERKSSVALIVQLPKLPEYHERMLARGLLKKLRADYGAPPRSEKEPEDEEKPENDEEAPRDEGLPSPPIQRAP